MKHVLKHGILSTEEHVSEDDFWFDHFGFLFNIVVSYIWIE